MNPVLGQGAEFERYLRQARAMRMHHGLLLTGPRGVGKSVAALHIARALLCVGDADETTAGPCGACGPCRRELAVHPDLHVLEIPEDKDEIPVDLVRELGVSLQRLPAGGRARVVMIDPADRLNVQGQNALLKTLEEPGRDTFLLLPTRRPEALLPTVRSRVADLAILPLAETTLRNELATRAPETEPADRDWAVDLAGGSLGVALTLLDGENRPMFELLEGFVFARRGTPVAVARAALHGASGRIEGVARARMALWMVRTILRKELLRTLATEGTGPYSPATSVRWTTQIETLFEAESDLSWRIPPEQVLVQALLSIYPGPGAEAHP